MKSLKAANHELSVPPAQLRILEDDLGRLPGFEDRLQRYGAYPLKPAEIEILQINLGRMCNQTCSHCHVDAGPDREEKMDRETMLHCLSVIERSGIGLVDLTGGAPEMNPHFTWLVGEIRALGAAVIVRSNLTILTVNDRYRKLPDFFARHGVTVISSLPCYTAANTDLQRGSGVFRKSIKALQMLNLAGYGRSGTGLELHLVYNPVGATLPGPQQALEVDYKRVLEEEFDVVFNRLFCLTNMPINRFLESLIREKKYHEYMERLIAAFNPATIKGLMCRNTISVGWDGTLFDCDFNQMLDLKVEQPKPFTHISQFDRTRLQSRDIAVGRHCFGCTAGAGSSCGGEIV